MNKKRSRYLDPDGHQAREVQGESLPQAKQQAVPNRGHDGRPLNRVTPSGFVERVVL